MEFQHTDKVKDLLERVTKFMDDHVYEGEKVYADQMTEFRNQGKTCQVGTCGYLRFLQFCIRNNQLFRPYLKY